MKNEKGFIFPVTLLITFIALTVVLTSAHIYLSKTRYINEAKSYYVRNSMITIALKKIIKQIENKNVQEHGVVIFDEGSVNYQIKEGADKQYQIILQTALTFGQATKNEVIYNQNQKKISKWLEN